MRGGRGRWLGLALAASLMTLVPAARAGAVRTCTTSPDAVNVYHWVGGQADHDWMNPQNWQHGPSHVAGAPNDNKSLGDPWTPGQNGDTQDTVVCIDIASGSDFTELDNSTTAFVWIQELHVTGSFTVHLKPENSGLLVMGPTTSTLGPQTVIDEEGTFGGWSRIETSGLVTLTSHPGFPATLSSEMIVGTTYAGNHGLLVVQPGGQLQLAQSGMALRYLYGVELHGVATLSNGYLAADHGTSFTISADGRFDLTDDNGYYSGFVAGQLSQSALVNLGLLRKIGGTGTSVVDAAYSEVGAGHVEVQSGTLSLPAGNTHQAQVAASRTLSTGTCATRGPTDPCVPTVDPDVDAQAVSFTVPASDGNGAQVLVQEVGVRQFLAHADDLQATAVDPARIELRMVARSPGETPDGLDVVHVDARGVEVVLPPCPAVGLPGVATNCVDRSSSHAAGGSVFMNVRTIQTSRYICRREDTVPPVFMGAPSAPRVKLGKPIVVTAAINEAGSIAVSGTIRTKRVKVRGLTLTGLARPEPGEPGRVVLRLKRHQKLKLRQSGATKGSIKLTITATDLHGNVTTTRVRVPLS